MKVNVISRKLIKPSTPTPQNLNKYKISFTDELSPPMNISVILFYPSNPKPILIEESLAKILPQFYPFAGRYIKKDHFVDCNDEGAEFVEAEAFNVELFDLIANTKNDQLNHLLSRQSYQVDNATDPLLSIQITKFKCGGLVISVTVSHRIADVSSIGTFIAAWSNANNPPEGDKTITIGPSFNSPMLFPGKNLENQMEQIKTRDPNIVVKRLLFNKEAIESLRSELNGDDGLFISRVRVVSGLIAKALIGVEIAKHGKSKACVIAQAVNIRGRTIPPLPKHSCGNLAIPSVTKTKDNHIMGFHELVCLLGGAIDKTIADCAEILSLGTEDGCNVIFQSVAKMNERSESGEEMKVLLFSDWSRFGFSKLISVGGSRFGPALGLCRPKT
ncbi:hypothetical protein DH2020_013156 [Rehmannia glutinosa]|uniref:Uncharacterized protein n=1 Tax=Rehmannia glutinosa TaxID=99300 RepID=A0ABR0X1I0_REHGL